MMPGRPAPPPGGWVGPPAPPVVWTVGVGRVVVLPAAPPCGVDGGWLSTAVGLWSHGLPSSVITHLGRNSAVRRVLRTSFHDSTAQFGFQGFEWGDPTRPTLPPGGAGDPGSYIITCKIQGPYF